MKFSHGWMADTHPEALRVYLEIQRRLSPEQKLRRVGEMFEAITALQRTEIQRQYPAASEREIFLRLASRRLGPALMQKVYGWQPDR